MRREELYSKSLIRKTVRELWYDIEPETVDQVIHKVDVEAARNRLPPEYRQVLRAWLASLTDDDDSPDWLSVCADLEMELGAAQETMRSLWGYLYSLLNQE